MEKKSSEGGGCKPVGQKSIGNKVIENKGKNGGKTMSKMIGAEKVDGPSID